MNDLPRQKRSQETLKRASGGDPLAYAVMELTDVLNVDLQDIIENMKQMSDDIRSIAQDFSEVTNFIVEKDLREN